jgi:hypothetical protein
MSYDISDIINEEYSSLDSTSTPREIKQRRIKKKILEQIILHSNYGISHINLTKIVGVERKTLRNYTKLLIKEKLIVRENIKHGKYYPSTKLHQRKDITAGLIIKSCLRNMFINSDFIMNSPYFKYNEIIFRRKLKEDGTVDNALFSFSNKIGAIVTFAIIESMNPENMIIPSNMTNQKLINYHLENWLNDSISTLVPFLQPLFKECIYNYLECLINKAYRSRSIKDPYGDMIFIEYLVKSSYLLDKEYMSEIHSAFFKVYPNLQDLFQKIKINIPNQLQKIEDNSKKILEKKKQQKKCKHKFISIHNQNDEEIWKCKDCGKLK